MNIEKSIDTLLNFVDTDLELRGLVLSVQDPEGNWMGMDAADLAEFCEDELTIRMDMEEILRCARGGIRFGNAGAGLFSLERIQ